MNPGEAGGGVVSQSHLTDSVTLRRRAREAMDEWKAHHRAIAARMYRRESWEFGRYRPAIATVEGMVVVAIHDDETEGRQVVAVDKYDPRDLADADRATDAQAQAEAHTEAEARA